jgi:hypothetical protein
VNTQIEQYQSYLQDCRAKQTAGKGLRLDLYMCALLKLKFYFNFFRQEQEKEKGHVQRWKSCSTRSNHW